MLSLANHKYGISLFIFLYLSSLSNTVLWFSVQIAFPHFVYLVLFLQHCPVCSFGTCSFVFLFCLHFCVCFYILGGPTMSTGVDRVVFWTRYPVRPSAPSLWSPEPGVSCVGCVCPPVGVWPQLLLACW